MKYGKGANICILKENIKGIKMENVFEKMECVSTNFLEHANENYADIYIGIHDLTHSVIMPAQHIKRFKVTRLFHSTCLKNKLFHLPRNTKSERTHCKIVFMLLDFSASILTY